MRSDLLSLRPLHITETLSIIKINMKSIQSLIFITILTIGLITSCKRKNVTLDKKQSEDLNEPNSKKGKIDTFVISEKTENDTTFYLRKEYPNKELLKLYSSNKKGPSFERFKKYASDDIRIRDNKVLLSKATKIEKTINQSILKQLKGRYVGGTILNNEIFISPWDYFCGNRKMVITDLTIFDVYGCEGFYEKPIINLYQTKENVIVLEALKYPNNHNKEFNKESSFETYKFFTSRSKSEGLTIVESNLFNDKRYFYLIHEKYFDQYKELKCHTSDGPCNSSLINFLNVKNTQEITKTIDNM